MLKQRGIRRCFQYDFVYGFLGKWKNYLFLFIMILFSCLRFKIMYGEKDIFSIGDYFFWNFKGMRVVTDLKKKFFVPDGFWIFYHLFLAYLIGFYPEQELKNNSHILMIHAQKRINWWISKCLWIVVSVFAYYATAAIGILFFSICTGAGKSLSIYEKTSYLFQIPEEGLNGVNILTYIILMCMLAIGISLFQVALSLTVSPIMSYIIVASVFSVSVFVGSGALWGNYFMLLRMYPFTLEKTINVDAGMIYAFFLSVLSFCLGYVNIKHKDIIQDRR